MLTLETIDPKTVNGLVPLTAASAKRRKQRVTITLPIALLERLRNAVYWTGHGPLAQLITDALTSAVTGLEHTHGSTFPQRLTPLKRRRPRRESSRASPGNGIHE